jgi:Family of unknown function (DUF5519)
MSTTMKSASERITEEVTSWPGVQAGPGRRGEFSLRVDGQELGHLHGDRAAHFGFPRELGAELRAQGRVGPHPVNPHSTKMAARSIDGEGDVAEVIALMRLNYERIVNGARGGAPQPRDAATSSRRPSS